MSFRTALAVVAVCCVAPNAIAQTTRQIEAGYACGGQPSLCSTTCGDGVKAGTEECDDGNTVSGDLCSSTCRFSGEPACVLSTISSGASNYAYSSIAIGSDGYPVIAFQDLTLEALMPELVHDAKA